MTKLQTLHTFLAMRIRSFGSSALEKLRDEEGIGVVEVILILLVLVGLVILFKDKITSLANSIFTNINSQVDGI